MAEKKQVFYWHVFKNALLGWSYDIDEKITRIKAHVPKAEIALRLRLMRPVIGKLPREVVEAQKTVTKTLKAYNKAKIGRVYAKAWKVYAAAFEAREEAVRRNRKAIKELHAKECPDCPWDGKTIFPANKA